MKVSTWQDFARITIETNDLDPTYVFLHRAKEDMGEDWATRFTMHYLCYYDLGDAVKAANRTNQDTFWKYMLENYALFHRGTERRHSRGELGLKYLTNLASKGTPMEIWDRMWGPTYTDLIKRFQTEFQGCGFGPYFVWKVLDFQDRIFGNKITLSHDEAVRHCPDDPRKCAKILWPTMDFKHAIEVVRCYIDDFTAPPTHDRPCSYQEAETVLCMLKGYFITKTHTIGDDVESKYKQLREHPEMLKYLPERRDWSQYERGPLVA